MASRRPVACAGVWLLSVLCVTAGAQVQWTVQNAIAGAPNLYDAVWNGSVVVAVGDSGGIYTSTDGVAWTKQNSGTAEDLCVVVWTGTQLVVAGRRGSVLASADALTWATVWRDSSLWIADMVWSGRRFVASSIQGAVITSVDPSHWTACSTGLRYSAHCLVWAGTQFVATENDTVVTSADGAIWDKHAMVGTRSLLSCVWDGSQLVGFDVNGTSIASTDGITWTMQSTSSSPRRAIWWTGYLFISTGSGGYLATSADGFTWTARWTGTPQGLAGLAMTSSGFVAVGAYGAVLTSPFDSSAVHPAMVRTHHGQPSALRVTAGGAWAIVPAVLQGRSVDAAVYRPDGARVAALRSGPAPGDGRLSMPHMSRGAYVMVVGDGAKRLPTSFCVGR